MNTPIQPRTGDKILNAPPVAAKAYPNVFDIPEAFMMYANPTTKQIVNNANLTSENVSTKVLNVSFQLSLIMNLDSKAATRIPVPIEPTRSNLNTAAISLWEIELIMLLWISGTLGLRAIVLKNALTGFNVQTKIIIVKTTNGDHATRISFNEWAGAFCLSFWSSSSPSNLQVVLGFQNWSKITIEINDTNEERMSGNCSPI